MAFAKFQENRFKIDGEIAENHAILVNLTVSISRLRLRESDIELFIFLSLSYRPWDNIIFCWTHTIHKFVQNSQKTLGYSPALFNTKRRNDRLSSSRWKLTETMAAY